MDSQPWTLEDAKEDAYLQSMEKIAAMAWYRKDKYGWPIELYKGRPITNFIRIVCQNIRKITG